MTSFRMTRGDEAPNRRGGLSGAEWGALGAVVALALAVATPAVFAARNESARTKCEDNLRAIGAAATKFIATNDGRLPSNQVRAVFGSWNSQLLSFIGEEKLADRYATGRDWWDATHSENRQVAAT
ncbi:MAG TPA: DUF1559 domain-containing protein, partial [Pirellulales bacterium]